MPAIFHVLTEFSFEGGSAIAEAGKIQAAVAGISTAADDAILSFKHLGMATLGSMGFGNLGLVGALQEAIKSSDKFRQSQINIAQLMYDGSAPFVERLGAAETIMGRINKIANEFALPADDMMQMVKLTAPMLRNSSGTPNFSLATDLSRNVLKAAPTLGVQPSLIMGQLQGMIGGFTTRNDTLFQRLTADTRTMKGMSSQTFNQMPEHKRIQTMLKAMGEFTADTKALEANVRSLTGQITILKNQVFSMFSVLRPLGDMILSVVIPSLVSLNDFIGKAGAEIMIQITRIFEHWMSNAKEAYVNIKAMKALGENFELSGKMIKIAANLLLLNFVLGLFGKGIPGVAKSFEFLTKLRAPGFLAKGPSFLGAKTLFAELTGLMSTLIGPLFLLVTGFQILSRAWAMWKYDNFVKSVAGLAKFTDMMARLSNIFNIFSEGMDVIAAMISRLGSWLLGIEQINSVLDIITTTIGLVVAGFEGLFLGLIEFFHQLKNLVTFQGFKGGQIADAFNFGVNDTLERVFGKIKPGEAIASMNNNFGDVHINNNIKQQMEPDRLAFTVVDQLKKASQNKTGSSGRAMEPVR